MLSWAHINSDSSPQTKQTKYICTTKFSKQIPEKVQTIDCSVQYMKTKLLSLEGSLRKTAEPRRTLEETLWFPSNTLSTGQIQKGRDSRNWSCGLRNYRTLARMCESVYLLVWWGTGCDYNTPNTFQKGTTENETFFSCKVSNFLTNWYSTNIVSYNFSSGFIY